MSDQREALLDCDKPELQEPGTPEGLERPRAIVTVLLIVIAVLALVAIRGCF